MAEASQRIPVFEKIGYSAGDAAANFVFMTMVIFQQAFYTDVMGLTPGKASMAILIPRLWDAFFDPIMGGLADRTRTRWGRFRPWVLWTSVPWGVVMFLAYFTPTGWSDAAMLTWAVITNMLLMTLYSANNMPYSALGGVMSADIQERNKLNSFRFIAVNAAQFIVVGFTPVLVERFGLSAGKSRAHGWEVTMGIYAVICVVFFLITFLTTNERVKPAAPTGAGGTPVRQDLADLLKNSPWAVMFVITFIHFAILSFRGGAEYQYFTRYLDKPTCWDVMNSLGLTAPALEPGQSPSGLFGQLGYIVYGARDSLTSNAASAVFGLFGMLGKVLTIIAIIFAPLLARRFGKKAICVAGFALVAVNYSLIYIVQPTQVGLLLLMVVTSSLFYAPTIPLVWAIFADVVDYGEWKLNRRATGMVFATIGFALKAGLAFGGAALSWVEAGVGYDPENPSAAVIQAFRVCTSIVPGILFAICAVLFLLYKLDKRMTLEIADELAQRRAKAATT
jgi:glycoside/pentoside/hexuronide:cation symporter, GPH family